jgi:protein-disulfide isomerase
MKKYLSIFILTVFFLAGCAQQSPEEALKLKENDWIKGSKDAPLTLIEYGDFQCPVCSVYQQLLAKLEEDFGTKLRLVYRHFPLVQIHANALVGAKAAEAAGKQGKFWEMYDLLYQNQKQWSELANPRELLNSYAKSVGLDVDKFMKDLDSEDVQNKIKTDYDSGNALGINGTPAFFLNGRQIENPTSYDDFKKLLESEEKGPQA